MYLEASSQEVELDLLQVLSLAQSDLDFADSCTGVLDGVTLNDSLNNMLCLSDLSEMRCLGILGKAGNHQIVNLGIRLFRILAVRVFLERALLSQHIACEVLNFKSLGRGIAINGRLFVFTNY